jgi:beta-glucosidase
MPSPGAETDDEVVAAVNAGALDVAAVDRAAGNVARLVDRVTREAGQPVDVDGHHALAREAAGRSIVLLKNDGDLLPLEAGRAVAVIGEFAESPRFQGGGSSHVNPTRLDVPLDEIRSAAGSHVSFSAGFTTDGSGDADALRREAVAAARAADTAVVFLGLAADQESEGFDRTHIELPAEQLELLNDVVAAQPRTVVVLAHGGVVRLVSVADAAPAIVDGALLGQAGGGAIADVLFGVINPSGKLTESVPVRLEDSPAYLTSPGEDHHVVYGERIFVGYRGFDARRLDVTFPFGHGLSYTQFDYGELRLSVDGTGVTGTVTVTNSGARAGREIVQLYVGLPTSRVARAPRSLVGFASTTLEPGESGDVDIVVRRQDLAYWDVRLDRWLVEGGDYEFSVGASSRDIRSARTVSVDGDDVRVPLTLDSTLAEVLGDPVAAPIVLQAMSAAADGSSGAGTGNAMGTDMQRMMAGIPLGRIAAFSGGRVNRSHLEQLLAHVNSQAETANAERP